MKNSAIAVIIPTYNEEEGIGPTLEELKKVLEDPSFIVIDKNSTDRTTEIAEKMGASVVIQEGEGKGRALAQVLKYIDPFTNYVVLIDADFTYPAEYIPEMIKILEDEPNVGMVVGNRFPKRFAFRKAVGNLLYLGNRCLALTQHLLNGVKLNDPLSGLRVLRWDVLKHWRPKSKGFDIEAELNHYIKREGYQTIEIPIIYRMRLGKKKLKLRDGFVIFKRILLESLTIRR